MGAIKGPVLSEREGERIGGIELLREGRLRNGVSQTDMRIKGRKLNRFTVRGGEGGEGTSPRG